MRKILTILYFILAIIPSCPLLAQEQNSVQGDKVALETAFLLGLKSYSHEGSATIPVHLSRMGKSLYVSDNGSYGTESVRNVSFFERTGKGFAPVCGSSMPVESVTTLLTGYSTGKEYVANVLFHLYGYKTRIIEVSLDQLTGYCMSEGSIPFVGVEDSEGDLVSATLFMVNNRQGYCHTFKFEIPKTMLDNAEGSFSAEAYICTPINNLHK